MSDRQIRPSTIDGIKRYAKTFKTKKGVTHAQALDLAARAGGFQNYIHARRGLEGRVADTSTYQAFISVPWRVRETKVDGQEILTVTLRAPLDALVKPAHLKAARHFGAFRFAAADHLTHDLIAGSQSDARQRACAVARTLAFMQATGLRPSSGRSRAYPRGDFGNAMPGKDHYSEWYDPMTKAYVFVDEPYSRGLESISQERLAWADRYGWSIARPIWTGMYNPDGGCELYLAAENAKGFDLKAACSALNALPPPRIEADWDGRSCPMFPPFVSPAAKAMAAAPRPVGRPRAKRGPKETVGYRTMLAQRERRRPATRMSVEGHIEVGRLLKSVIYPNRSRRSIYKPLDGVRCDLDDWVQCEYDRTELSDAVFFDLYYHEDELPQDSLAGALQTACHVERLAEAKRLLAAHYPDCAPLRSLFKSIDRAAKALKA